MEQVYAKMIKERRTSELEGVRGVLYLRATTNSFNFLLQLSIFVCIASASSFTASSTYVVISYYNMLFTSMLQFWPLLVTHAIDAYRTIERAQQLLTADTSDGDDNDDERADMYEDVTSTKQQLMSDRKEATRRVIEESAVKGISIRNLLTRSQVRCDQLDIGTGKTCALVSSPSPLFDILLGEMELESGDIDIGGSISYASKSAWIFAGSIRENIVFTEQFDAERYSMILKVVEIEKEIQALPTGDDTLIDEFCVSDGFKMKIHLARCLYRDADIYLIDDCFAGMGARVIEEAFEKIFKVRLD
jgi:ATP-binding cassette subfamily C (CFTR/MRP) protein 4